MNVILIGYRCAGKTTVGRMLSERLEMRFFDTDKLVEAKAKMPILKIFEQSGEGEFRRFESEVIQEISGGEGKVISVGGGGVCRQANITNLRKRGRIVFLKISPEEVKRRLENDPQASATRPSLTRDDVIEEAREMIDRRERFYREAADHTVETDGRAPEDISNEVMKLIKSPPAEKKDDSRSRRRFPGPHIPESAAAKKRKEQRRSESTGGFPREM